MNQETNNNLENTQAVPTSTPENVVNTQAVPTTAAVSGATEELEIPTAEATPTAEPVQPAIAPTVTVSSPIEEGKIEVVEGQSNTEIGTQPHDVPIPDENNKKDFVIKSKKETVAEDVKAREAKIEEHVKKANENYKPNSKATNVFLVIFLTFMIAFCIFLPQIREFVTKWESGKLNEVPEVKITNGVLECDYERSSEELEYKYHYKFKFSKNTLESYEKSTTIRGDASIDGDKLSTLKENCNAMRRAADEIDGIEILCSAETNKVITTEKLELKDFNNESITPAYTEAGGEYPEYSFEQDMDEVEKNMKAAGFTCERSGV